MCVQMCFCLIYPPKSPPTSYTLSLDYLQIRPVEVVRTYVETPLLRFNVLLAIAYPQVKSAHKVLPTRSRVVGIRFLM